MIRFHRDASDGDNHGYQGEFAKEICRAAKQRHARNGRVIQFALRRSVPEPCVYGFEYIGPEKPSMTVGAGSGEPLLISACLRKVGDGTADQPFHLVANHLTDLSADLAGVGGRLASSCRTVAAMNSITEVRASIRATCRRSDQRRKFQPLNYYDRRNDRFAPEAATQ